MKNFVALAICSLSLVAQGLSVSAAPAKKSMAKVAPVMCPACKAMGMPMMMTAKKTKMNTRAVKVNGKTMYCCPMCKMTTVTTKKPASKKM